MNDFWQGDEAWGDEPDWAKLEEEEAQSNNDYKNTSGDDNAGEDGNQFLGAQHLLLLVDCHLEMFPRGMEMTLQLTETLLRKLIRNTVTLKIGKRNGVGLLLYHVQPRRKNKKKTSPDDVINHDDNKNDNKQDAANESSSDDDSSEDDDDEKEEDEQDEDEESSSDDDSSTAVNTVHELLPLEPPGIPAVQTIRQCLHGKRDLRQEFSTDKGDEDFYVAPLKTALEEAMRMFRQAKCVKQDQKSRTKDHSIVDTRSIWIFTRRENPYPSSSYLLQNVARDAKEQGIQIIVWPLPAANSEASGTSDFDSAPFYRDLVSCNAFGDRRFQSQEELEDGLEDLQQQWKKTRRAFYGPMWLPGDDIDKPAIMVDWFRLVQLAKKPGKITLDQNTMRETVVLRQLMDQRGNILETSNPSKPSSGETASTGFHKVKQFAEFGGEFVPISQKDVEDMKFQANGRRNKPGLQIIGFKPQDSIPFYHTMESPYFIYPNDELVKGSRKAFIELHASMLRKKVLAICEALHRVTSTSMLMAIYPLEEILDDDGKQKRPPGMRVVKLPFKDDMRGLEADAACKELASAVPIPSDHDMDMPAVKSEGAIYVEQDDVTKTDPHSVERNKSIASEELVQATMELIARQQLADMELGEDFENAALTEFFTYLESVALELPAAEPEEFDTRLEDDIVLEAARDQIAKFEQALPDDDVAETSVSTSRKRKKVVADDSGLDWEDLFYSNSLASCKVADLKSYLKSVGETLRGNKADLVERVYAHLEKSISERNMQGGGKVKIEL